LHHPPATGIAKGALLYIHPFAEEMNKSRRMAAQAARALAAKGFAVLQIDLLGCGDSSGDFGDATWQIWVDDVTAALDWLAHRHPGAPLWLWGLRAGALLCVAAASARPALRSNFLFWQPATRGQLVLTQFLRVLVAAALHDGTGKAAMEAARAALAAGQYADVAGYSLSPTLAKGLEVARLDPPSPVPTPQPAAVQRLIWLELGDNANNPLAPASETVLQAWAAAGFDVQATNLVGPRFWQTVEIEDAPDLIDASVACVCASGSASSAASREPAPAGA
jgi:exosortase A-associated hydrolase 2